MHTVKIFLASVIIFSSALIGASKAETFPEATPASNTIMFEVLGTVPGYTHTQLSIYLAQKMQEETHGAWHFEAGKLGDSSYPNRVVWSFKKLRMIWKGGSHSGFPAPPNLVTYLRAEVKLYFKGVYQMTMDTHPTVDSGTDDTTLAEMVHNVAYAMFVENKHDL